MEGERAFASTWGAKPLQAAAVLLIRLIRCDALRLVRRWSSVVAGADPLLMVRRLVCCRPCMADHPGADVLPA